MCRIEFFSRVAGTGVFIAAGKSPAPIGREARFITVVFESYMNPATLGTIDTAEVNGLSFRAELESLTVNGKVALFRVALVDLDHPPSVP